MGAKWSKINLCCTTWNEMYLTNWKLWLCCTGTGSTAILSCPSFLSLCKSFLPKHACVVLPTEMGEMDKKKKKTWKNIHLCSRLLCFTHMCCSIHRQLTTAQLCTTDAIRGLEEGLKCCEQKYPTLLLTQANHCGYVEC